MAFQVSPGVNVSEIDLTTVVPQVSTTDGAIAGLFRWGPVERRILIGSADELVSRFGKPTNYNAETFFSAANFLAYGNQLFVVRTANTTSANTSERVQNATANVGAVGSLPLYVVKNKDDYDAKDANGNFVSSTGVAYVARYPGVLGNSLKISVVDSNTGYYANSALAANSSVDSNVARTFVSATIGNNIVRVAFANSATGTLAQANAIANTLLNALTVSDYIEVGNTSIGIQRMKITALSSLSSDALNVWYDITTDQVYGLSTNFTGPNQVRWWQYFQSVDVAPGQSAFQAKFGNTSAQDELHVVVVDEDGLFSGVPGTVLEVWKNLSRATDSKTDVGNSNYYKTVINMGSNYVYFANDRAATLSAPSLNLASSATLTPLVLSFLNGSDGLDEYNVPVATLTTGYDQFASPTDVDISIVIAGKPRGGSFGEQLSNYIIDNICEVRRDCVICASPDKAAVVNNVGNEDNSLLNFRNAIRSTTYALSPETGWKYQYDKYNDVYRWIPQCGDMAGLLVRTDNDRDAWWSPAGFNRGQIKNIVKLSYNPKKASRDLLFKAGLNPVVTFPGQGTYLFGDKTLSPKPSDFDAINVRRLFIVLEKAISTAAKFQLFEFNDAFTQAQFRNMVEPFLRDIQGRRGLTDFRVVCDSTNNTAQVQQSKGFVGDIYIKPPHAIRYIQLNFVAVRGSVSFDEVVGQF